MGSALTGFGILFSLVSGWLIINGLQIVPAVPAPGLEGFLPPGSQGVANLHLMHVQAMNFHLGIGSGVAGAIFLAAAAIIGAIQRGDTDAPE